ncbi:MAG: CoA pyrophosphatase [Chloroflexi bacterium]|nr:CoA pyrophosphatase [Chloroflexota bacterium]
MTNGRTMTGAPEGASPAPSLDRIEQTLRGRAGDGANDIEARPAAVLVPFCMVDGEPSVLFIRRSLNLHNHPGQMAFPGGAADDGDDGLAATAVRETVEELGLTESEIDVWGTLDPLRTISDFALSPFTGWLSRSSDLEFSEREVSEVLTVPVAALLDGSCDRDETRTNGSGYETRSTYAYNGRVIWGSTGQIVSQLIDCLRDA